MKAFSGELLWVMAYYFLYQLLFNPPGAIFGLSSGFQQWIFPPKPNPLFLHFRIQL